MMSIKLQLTALTPNTLANLCGPHNETLKQIETRLGVVFKGQPGDWSIDGDNAKSASEMLQHLAQKAEQGPLAHTEIEGLFAEHRSDASISKDKGVVLKAGYKQIQGKTQNQRRYIETIQQKVLTLAVGPAGSGKTYLAVAAAVAALNSHQVERIILTRPAVEAGERLGFLPGDLQQKVDPYLRPLFDALTDMLGVEKMNALLESGQIEIAPLAYMRGRTLNDAFIILDEAQNTTRAQMKMFLTRLGFASKMVVTGDATQTDLPTHQHSGLLHALHVLKAVNDIGVCRLAASDVVRHHLVEQIVNAYDANEND
ncbi:MAG: PhoH family protein [Mariprofundaceae bacterium]